MSSPWNKPKLIAMAQAEQNRRDFEDTDALMQFCQNRFKGPRHAAPVLFTVFCSVLAELYEKGEFSDRALKAQGTMMRNCVKKLAKTLRKG
jgi:hypothetical protein